MALSGYVGGAGAPKIVFYVEDDGIKALKNIETRLRNLSSRQVEREIRGKLARRVAGPILLKSIKAECQKMIYDQPPHARHFPDPLDHEKPFPYDDPERSGALLHAHQLLV